VDGFRDVGSGGAAGACSDGDVTTRRSLGVGGVCSRRRVTAAEGSFATKESLCGGGEWRGKVRFAVRSLHHFDGPCFQIDWGTLSGLDKVVVVLEKRHD